MKAGEMIGPWRIGKGIGRGGQGVVYEASRDEAEKNVALKLINLSTAQKRARFIQEVKTHAAFSARNTPNIIPIIDHNLENLPETGADAQGYIVMPQAAHSLEDVKAIYTMRTELCLETFLGVLNGTRAAHAEGVVHRDIKPSNVLFLGDELRNPLISDFGICFLKESSERITEVGETVGARFFMAPEQEGGGITDVDTSADVYALGKLLHYMITSRYLKRERLHEAFQPSEIESDSRLEIVHRDLLARTIVEDKTKRIQTAGELYEIASKILNSSRT